MLRSARKAQTELGEAAGRVAGFLHALQQADGGFADRAGKSDLYYTVFGLQALTALGAEFRRDAAETYLASFGTGAELDLVHLGCLARCWDCLPDAPAPAKLRDGLLARLPDYRSADGGYAQHVGAEAGSAYGCFLALGLSQDLGVDLPDADGVIRCVESLAAPDGSYANDPALPIGSVPATAAATAVLHHLGRDVPEAVAAWLPAQQADDGGFLAIPAAPESDLLSTATALHALSLLGADLSAVRQRCLAFIWSLHDARGGFAGHRGDETPDAEYTDYALLSLGHLSPLG